MIETDAYQKAAERTFEEFAPLALHIANAMLIRLPRFLTDDVKAAARVGLWSASRRRGKMSATQFRFYASARIHGAVLDELRTQDWLPRRARRNYGKDMSQIAVESLNRPDEHMGLSTPSHAETVVSRVDLQNALRSLTEKERMVFDRVIAGVKFKQIGNDIGVSEPRISQIVAKLKVTLRRAINS